MAATATTTVSHSPSKTHIFTVEEILNTPSPFKFIVPSAERLAKSKSQVKFIGVSLNTQGNTLGKAAQSGYAFISTSSDIVISSGPWEPNNPEIAGKKMGLAWACSIRLEDAGEFGVAMQKFDTEFKTFVAEDLLKRGDFRKKFADSKKGSVVKEFGKEGSEFSAISFTANPDEPFSDKSPNQVVAGKPKTTIYDWTKPIRDKTGQQVGCEIFTLDGKPPAACTMSADIDEFGKHKWLPRPDANLHLILKRGTIIKRARWLLDGISCSNMGIHPKLYAQQLYIVPPVSEVCDDETFDSTKFETTDELGEMPSDSAPQA
ncbi:MAG: hypothetical protein M0R33_13800 [Methylomonas sp.]|jgi:hypothetical protein|uniref:hypothetical protein n=1 Tax=Methylomonas sp. TaxID=418 RepID=UPI0025EFEBF6|nr:hypothetical protein [Methylomonas sp.]MCK9607509.1 hypothetical protein [Methylomonas sp.]